MSEVPEGLTELEYAKGLLSDLGWPMRGNIELIADCIGAVARSRKLSSVQGYKYLTRAVKLAKEQGIDVNRMFFMNGDYMNVRPRKPSGSDYSPPDWKAVKAHQSSPEFDQAWSELVAATSRIFGIPPTKRKPCTELAPEVTTAQPKQEKTNVNENSQPKSSIEVPGKKSSSMAHG